MQYNTQWILPMAGKGTRTAKLGDFKPFIEVCGKKILQWLLSGIRNNFLDGDILFLITLDEFNQKYDVFETASDLIHILNFPRIEIHTMSLNKVLEGPSLTISSSFDKLQNDLPVVIVNTDQFIVFDYDSDQFEEFDGLAAAYCSVDPRKSYFDIENKNTVSKIIEKKCISPLASAGMYAFKSAELMKNCIKMQIANNESVEGEYFIGPSMNNIKSFGGKIGWIPTTAKLDLGNEQSITRFEQIFGAFS